MKSKTIEKSVQELAEVHGLKNIANDVFMDANGNFWKLASCNTDNGKTKCGYTALQVPDPRKNFDDQMDELLSIYDTATIVKACVAKLVIEKQAADRRRATGGDNKMPQSYLRSYFNTEYTEYLRAGGEPLKHEEIEAKAADAWKSKNPTGDAQDTIWF